MAKRNKESNKQEPFDKEKEISLMQKDKKRGKGKTAIKTATKVIVVNRSFKDVTGGDIPSGVVVIPTYHPHILNINTDKAKLGILVRYIYLRNLDSYKEGKQPIHIDISVEEVVLEDGSKVSQIKSSFIECTSKHLGNYDKLLQLFGADLEKILNAKGQVIVKQVN